MVDNGNGYVSHSEGQGFERIFAVAFDGPDSFDLILDWTTRSLAHGENALFSWRYLPQARCKVPDRNNATDADLFIAAALWPASQRWGRPDHEAAAPIAQDVLRLLVREAGPRLLLLPRAAGFEEPGALTINPSYHVFPVLDEMARLLPSPHWARLRADGLALLEDGRFGTYGLPPDWLRVDRRTGAMAPHLRWPARFSSDAIRVPLYLAWAGQASTAAARAFGSYWSSLQPAPPAWVDLTPATHGRMTRPPPV